MNERKQQPDNGFYHRRDELNRDVILLPSAALCIPDVGVGRM